MGRSRSRSYSPTTLRRDWSRSPLRRSRRRDADDGGAARRKSYRGREPGGRYSSAPTSLLVRNIARDSRPEDVRASFERFGPIKDVYLPKDYYSGMLNFLLTKPILHFKNVNLGRVLKEAPKAQSGPPKKKAKRGGQQQKLSKRRQGLQSKEEERTFKFKKFEDNVIVVPLRRTYLFKGQLREPRGFGFVQYRDPADAADAQFRMDRQILAGREITVVFAEDNRKKPSEMRVQELSITPTRGVGHRHSGGRGGGFNGDKYRRRSPGRRIRSLSRSRSPPSRRHTSGERFAGSRDKRSKHGASSPAKRSSSPEANGQRAEKSRSRSLSPRPARSSASKSDSLE